MNERNPFPCGCSENASAGRSSEEKAAPRLPLLRRAAVLGAGTMGSRIAAHLANAGLPVVLLDIVPASRPIPQRLAVCWRRAQLRRC